MKAGFFIPRVNERRKAETKRSRYRGWLSSIAFSFHGILSRFLHPVILVRATFQPAIACRKKAEHRRGLVFLYLSRLCFRLSRAMDRRPESNDRRLRYSLGSAFQFCATIFKFVLFDAVFCSEQSYTPRVFSNMNRIESTAFHTLAR